MVTKQWIPAVALASLGLLAATGASAQVPPSPPPGAESAAPPPGMQGGPHGQRGMHGGMHGGMRDGMRGGMRERRGPGEALLSGRMAAELGLSDEQKQKIRATLDASRPAMRDVMENARGGQRRLRSLSPDDAGWNKAVDEASRQAADAAARRVREGARVRAEVWKLLTPEQRQKLTALEAEREKRMQQRVERMRQTREQRGRGN